MRNLVLLIVSVWFTFCRRVFHPFVFRVVSKDSPRQSRKAGVDPRDRGRRLEKRDRRREEERTRGDRNDPKGGGTVQFIGRRVCGVVVTAEWRDGMGISVSEEVKGGDNAKIPVGYIGDQCPKWNGGGYCTHKRAKCQ